MNQRNLTLFAAVCCALGLFFMDRETAQRAAIPETAAPDTGGAEAVSPADSSQESRPTDDAQANDQPAAIEALQVAFEPPFPDRTNLFQAPQRQGRGRSESNGHSESNVELLGFVNVNGSRVALSIDGMVTTIAEGDQMYGIEVISIQPPSVFLRRGKQRWQASFEN